MSVGAIFVDGANMSRSLTARFSGQRGRRVIDYGLLAKVLEHRYGIPFCYRTYYTTHRDKEAEENRKFFYDHLKQNGWTVFDFQARFITSSDHPDGIWMDKGVDLAIGLDAYRLALMEKNLGVLVLATHDADFAQLFKRLPPSVKGAVVGWKGSVSLDLLDVVEPVYLDGIGVVTVR